MLVAVGAAFAALSFSIDYLGAGRKVALPLIDGGFKSHGSDSSG